MTETKTEELVGSLQLLTFCLGDEEYGVEVAHVQEVLELIRITKVPRSLDYMKGIINLRGRVVPVIDLRSKLDLEESEHTISTAIVVMEIPIANEISVVGAIADSVQEVVNISTGDIDPAPQIGTSVDRRFIRGIGKSDEKFTIILDIAQLFDSEELQIMQASNTISENND